MCKTKPTALSFFMGEYIIQGESNKSWTIKNYQKCDLLLCFNYFNFLKFTSIISIFNFLEVNHFTNIYC